MVDIKREKESAETCLAIIITTFIMYVILTIIGTAWKYTIGF